jgi:glycosyltransferase involved in cell wall biosynthesis
MRILFFGTYDVQHHPRVQVLREGLAARGHEVPECNVPLRVGTEARVRALRRLALAPLLVVRVLACWAHLVPRARQLVDPDIVLVGYLGHFDVLLARGLWPRATIVLDHLAPAAEVAADRGMASRWVYVLLNALDRWALSVADIVLIDTEEHRALLPPDAQDRVVVVPVGASDVWFGAPPPPDSDGVLRVVFFGTYTPLQGTPVIGEAIALLAGRADVRVTMIGRGQDYAAVRRLVGGNRQVRWLEWLEPRTLVRAVAEHDVCLGIFGVTAKAARVVPTKVYQGAAAGCAIVTSSTAPQERMLGSACLAVPPGDARALAQALAMLADRPDLVATARQRATAQAAHYRSALAVLPLHCRLLNLSQPTPHRRGR